MKMVLELPDETNVLSATLVIDESDYEYNRQFVTNHTFRCEDGKTITMVRLAPGKYRYTESTNHPAEKEEPAAEDTELQHVGYTKESMGYEK